MSDPPAYICRNCKKPFKVLANLICHQEFHSNERNFSYYCPVQGCIYHGKTRGALKFHVSMFHRNSTHQVLGEQALFFCCVSECSAKTESLWHLVQHYYGHLDNGVKINCPIKGCKFYKCFEKKSTFKVHLSQYHSGWKDNGVAKDSVKRVVCDDHDQAHHYYEHDEDNDVDGEYDEPIGHNSDDDNDLFSDEILLESIGKFYLKLIGPKQLSYDVLQDINNLSFLTLINHARMKQVLKRELEKYVPGDEANSICYNVMSSDVLYNTHHKNAPGPSLTSTHLRKEYFRKNFSYLDPEAINLSNDPEVTDQTLQYVSVHKTLLQLFQDESIQKDIADSFEVGPATDPDLVSDFTQGSLYREENHPVKEVRLNVYQDSFNGVMNVLGSAKSKYKELVVYFTIANLKAHNRSKIESKNFVLIVRESVFKTVGSTKAFEHLIKELLSLEADGITFREEQVPVVVMFVLGDNLGQHIVGGFTESFSNKFFCRYCDITAAAFKSNPALLNDPWTKEHYARCLLRANLTGKITKGVKRKSDFDQLKYFHAIDHLPPCLAHDIFEGVVKWDLAGIVEDMVNRKLFTYPYLNYKIKKFKCIGYDINNRPAHFALTREKSYKLSGHAVQNWALLRLLPFLIGEKVQDPAQDPAWCMYLKLKELCEYFTAPVFKKTDIPYLKDVFIPEYFDQRAVTLNQQNYPLRPKHHYSVHFPDLMLKYGPLIHLWTLSYEQKHKFFKQAIRQGKFFINLEHSLAQRHQLFFCYQSTGPLLQTGCNEKKSAPVFLKSYPEIVKNFITGLGLSSTARGCDAIIYQESINYKLYDALLLSSVEGQGIDVGIIQAIIMQEEEVSFVIDCKCALYNQNYGIYQLPLNTRGVLKHVAFKTLVHPVPQPAYYFNERLVISLKYQIVN